jgi:uncharacterized membrane protein YdjX (TVP38/TMEM64 family)
MYLRWTLLFSATVAAILIPFFFFGESIEAWARATLNTTSARWLVAAAAGGLLAFDIFLPVPSSLVSTAAGALLGFWGGLATSWIGMCAGCALGYALGGSMPAPERDRMHKAWTRYGDWALILFRAIPVLAEASVFFAGLSRMPRGRFAALVAVSNFAISAVYAGAGAFSAERDTFLWAFAGAILLPGAGLLIWRKR